MGAECSTPCGNPERLCTFDDQKETFESFNNQQNNVEGSSATPEVLKASRPKEVSPLGHARPVDRDSGNKSHMKKQFRVQRLMNLAQEGQFLAIEQLLGECVADREEIVNEIDELNDTALHKAARMGHVMACRSLIQNGAEVYRNGEGRTPYEVAVANNRTDCMAFLQLVDKIARAESVEQSNHEPVTSYERSAPTDENKNVNGSGDIKNPQVGGTDAPSDPQASDPQQKGKVWANVPSEGVAVVALYDFQGSPDPPFAQDSRLEASMSQGDVFFLVRMRADGWCIVQKPSRDKEYYVPGNYVSMNGVEPLVIEE